MGSKWYLLLVGASLALHARADLDPSRCRAEAPGDLKLYSSDLAWNQPFNDMIARYSRIYQSGKRLTKRAYWDSVRGGYMLPYHGSTVSAFPITEDFIGAVRTHIEKALARKYADAVFFSDMGHSHMLIPKRKFEEEYRFGAGRLKEFYTKALADGEIRFLYHTAEQLDTAGGDPHLEWRKNTRNLVGENRPGGEVHVESGYHEPGYTLRDVAGYHWWSAGFNLSASRDGCFPFVTPSGEISYFDISLYDLEPEGGGSSLFRRRR